MQVPSNSGSRLEVTSRASSALQPNLDLPIISMRVDSRRLPVQAKTKQSSSRMHIAMGIASLGSQ
jgi:hypothetical protein